MNSYIVVHTFLYSNYIYFKGAQQEGQEREDIRKEYNKCQEALVKAVSSNLNTFAITYSLCVTLKSLFVCSLYLFCFILFFIFSLFEFIVLFCILESYQQ